MNDKFFWLLPIVMQVNLVKILFYCHLFFHCLFHFSLDVIALHLNIILDPRKIIQPNKPLIAYLILSRFIIMSSFLSEPLSEGIFWIIFLLSLIFFFLFCPYSYQSYEVAQDLGKAFSERAIFTAFKGAVEALPDGKVKVNFVLANFLRLRSCELKKYSV